MNRELSGILASVADLTGRVSEVSKRLRQDTLLLLELQQELSRRLERAWKAAGDPEPAGPPPLPNGPRMLRLADVVKKVGLSRASIYKMISASCFPQPRRLGPNSVRWVDVEVDEWLRARELATAQTWRRLPRTTSRR
jgi:prophage regulatory protein